MKGFRQIRTSDQDLMKVQDNVRDALGSIAQDLLNLKAIPDNERYFFWAPGSLSGMTNAVFTDSPNQFELPPGDLYFGLVFTRPRVDFSVLPTSCENVTRTRVVVSNQLLGETGFAVSRFDATSLRSCGSYIFTVENWQGGFIKQEQRIISSGGTVTSRNSQANQVFIVRVA